jgi:hypothetical protein
MNTLFMRLGERSRGFVTVLLMLMLAAPSGAYAHGGGGNHNDDSSNGVVPYPKTITDFKGFRLNAPYKLVGGQPTATGVMSDAHTFSLALKDYVEATCVPFVVTAKNGSNKIGDIRFSLSYEYEAGLLMGADNLEVATYTASGNPVSGADNLNDFTYPGNAFSHSTSFKLDNGVTVNADVDGPYSGDNTGKAPVWPFNGYRHYNVRLDNVPPGRTAYVTGCTRISDESHIFIDDFIKVSLNLGGQTEDKLYIQKSKTTQLPKVELKVDVNTPGVTPNQFSFTAVPPINGHSVFNIQPGQNKVVINNVPPEQSYTFTISGPSGVMVTSGSGTNCAVSGSQATATPAPGNPPVNATCQFNIGPEPPAQAKLKVTKVVVNNNGGTKTVTDFPLFVNGDSVASGEERQYAPGTYTVTETTDTDYVGTFSGDCNAAGQVTLAAGNQKHCILTNDDAIARLTVTKVVINDNGGTLTVQDFPLFIDGQPVNSGEQQLLGPGTYQVTEQANTGYAPSFSGDCDAAGNVTLALGQVKQCVMTNNDVAPTLTVTKVVVNDNTGTKTVTDFPMLVNGVTPIVSGVEKTFNPGTYQVTEPPDAQYEGIFTGDCDQFGTVSLALGDHKACVLTNDDIPPPATATLTVTKIVVNDNDGTKTVEDFPLFVNGTPVLSGVTSTYAPGEYTVSETAQAGYAGTFHGDCDAQGNITLAAGDIKQCVIINDDPDATLVVHVNVINNNGGFLGPDDFPFNVQGLFYNNNDVLGLSAGTVRVQTVNNPRYVGTFGGDCDADGFVTLDHGDNKACTLTFEDVASGLIVITKIINDRASEPGTLVSSQVSTFVQAFGAPLAFIPGSDTGVHFDILPGPFLVSQLPVDGYDIAFEGDCFGNIGVGEVLSCTLVNDDV